MGFPRLKRGKIVERRRMGESFIFVFERCDWICLKKVFARAFLLALHV